MRGIVVGGSRRLNSPVLLGQFCARNSRSLPRLQRQLPAVWRRCQPRNSFTCWISTLRREACRNEILMNLDAPVKIRRRLSKFNTLWRLSSQRQVSYVSNMKEIRSIIFDLDGTLVHSAPDLHAAVNVVLAGLGREPLELHRVISFIGNGVEKLVERSLAATGEVNADLLVSSLSRFRRNYKKNMTRLTRPYPGVVECLGRLRSEGAKLGVCTNKPTEPARAICDQLGLAQYIDVIVGAERGKPKKPDAAPLLSCVSALGGSKSKVMYVGDSEIDYQTALNAYIPFRLYLGGYLRTALPDLGPSDRFDDWHECGI